MGFLILLSDLNLFNSKVSKRVEKIKNIINSEYTTGRNLSELLLLLTNFEPRMKIEKYDFLQGFLDVDYLSEDVLKELLDFLEEFDVEDDNVLSQTKNIIEEFFQNEIQNNHHIYDINFSDNISYNIDIDGIKSEIDNCLEFCLVDFNRTALNRIEFDKSNIISSLNIEKMADEYLADFMDDDDDGINDNYNDFSNQDNIDAIFER